MKVLIVGQTGQLASELVKSPPKDIDVIALGRPQLDLAKPESISNTLATINPSVIINASAYTAVDKAESEPDAAYAINAEGVKALAEAAKQVNARLLHVSTDFVFGKNSALGADGIAPLLPDANVDPLGVYGASKLAGEQAIQQILSQNSVIVRTAWVYSSTGNNFVKTMLRLMADKPELGIIVDQIGTPTWARGLAEWLWAAVAKPDLSGVYHWTDAGAASWYDFAIAIQELALEKGLLGSAILIKAISTSSYPTPAKRPGYSVLDKTSAEQALGIVPTHWRKQLSMMLDELKGLQE